MTVNLTKTPATPPHAVRLTKVRKAHRLTKVSLVKAN